ncbi:MAG: FHA domain-containing protein [Phycisphaerae bacterium]|nr:FHA domain-containing protein [Phycisphaerae bacterium]
MFGRNLANTRIRAAEAALADGRIDEALAAALDPALADAPRRAALIDGLSRPLLARARLAMLDGDAPAAIRDLDRLTALGFDSPDARDLRARATQARDRAAGNAAAQREAEARVAGAGREGRLDSMRVEIDNVADADRRARLERELSGKLERIEQILNQAQSALLRDDLLGAARLWRDAVSRHGRTQQTDDFGGRLATGLAGAVQRWVAAGELAKLAPAEEALEALAGGWPGVEPAQQAIGLCRRAAEQLAIREDAALRQTLLRLQAVVRDATWVNAALKDLSEVISRREALVGSPLGALMPDATVMIGQSPVPPAAHALPATPVRTRSNEADGGLLMLIDGGGSSLWLRQPRIRLGRRGSSGSAEIGLPGDLLAVHAEIVREEQDYFLVAHGPAEVNQRSVKRVLLRNGDRVRLGSSAKFVFAQPTSRSGSAVLNLNHECRLPDDVGMVVLFDETALIGPQPTCHVRTRDTQSQVVVFEREGAYFVQETPSGQRGHLGSPKRLEIERTQDIGDVRITARKWNRQIANFE